jgi:hypothetical protein
VASFPFLRFRKDRIAWLLGERLLSPPACSPVGTSATPARRIRSRREPSPPGSPGPCARPSATPSAGPPRFGKPSRLAPSPRGANTRGIPGGIPAGVRSQHVNGDEGAVKNTQQSPPRLGVAPPRLGAQHPQIGAGMDKRSRRAPSAPRARRRPAGRKTTAPARFLHFRNVVSGMFHQRARQDAADDAEHGGENAGSGPPEPNPGST